MTLPVNKGGRPLGSQSKTTRELQKWLDEDLVGIGSKYQHPLARLLEIANNDVPPIMKYDKNGNMWEEGVPVQVQVKALSEALKYIMPTATQKIEITGADGTPLFEQPKLTEVEIRARLGTIAGLLQQLPTTDVIEGELVETETDNK